ncbi:putative signal peptide-containing protein [Cryptosporidium hominis]
MMLRYGSSLILVNLLTLILLQGHFGQIGCKSSDKGIAKDEINFEEDAASSFKLASQYTPANEGKIEVISLNELLKGVSRNKNNSSNESIDFTDNDYSIPTESNSDGRLTGMSRGRSRNRRFKFRFGEVPIDSSIETSSSSANSEPEGEDKEKEMEKIQNVKEKPFESDTSSFSVVGGEKSTSIEMIDKSEPSANSDAETEPEKIKSPIPIIPVEEEVKPNNSVDQVIELLHQQSNLDALREQKRKKEFKKEKLENQEKVMDKLISVIDSMQKRSPLKKEYAYGAVMNHNISDLRNQELFYEGYMDSKNDGNEDSLRRLRDYEEKKIRNELKNASLTRTFYSKPSSALASELNAYSAALNSSPKKNGSGSGSGSIFGSGSDSGSTSSSIFDSVSGSDSKSGSKKEEAAISKSIDLNNPKTRSVSVGFSDSSIEDYSSGQSHISESGRSSPADNNVESRANTDEYESSTEENLRIKTPTLSQTHKSYSTSSPKILDNLAEEEEELGIPGTNPEKRPSESPIKMLESELMKLQDLVELDLKKSTASNSFGRVKPKTSYTQDEYLVRTSSPEENILNTGKVGIGRIRRTRESIENKTYSPENKSVSKPFVTVGRLKSPTRATSIDKMRPIKEDDDDSNFDHNTATGVFNIRSTKVAMDSQNARLKMEEQLRNPYSAPLFSPSDILEARETHFIGDKPQARSQPNAFRRGMMASMSQNMAGNPFPAGLGPPLVRVQKVKGEMKKKLIRRKM